MFGFLNVNKPAGMSSFDVIRRLRRQLPRKTKIGHAGTLDPFADGVLVVCVGPATRLADRVQGQTKQYRAEVTLGAASTTDDPEGDITPTAGAAAPDRQAVRDAAAALVGRIEQVPPAHSAVHVDGRRAYKLARAGKEVNLPPRPVVIHAIDVLGYDYPRLELAVTCGSGTYIRSLARDIGASLGVGGYCTALTRTAVGRFTLAEAVEVDQADVERDLIDAIEAVPELPRLVADDAAIEAIKLGQAIPGEPEGPEIAVVDAAGKLLAIAAPGPRDGLIRPVKVFCAGPGQPRRPAARPEGAFTSVYNTPDRNPPAELAYPYPTTSYARHNAFPPRMCKHLPDDASALV